MERFPIGRFRFETGGDVLITALTCIPCLARQAAESAEMSTADGPARERLARLLLREIADADWRQTPVTISQRLQRLVRSEGGARDPYRELKMRMNTVALDLLPTLAAAAARQPDPREAAVRLAIAGNLLDAGSKNRLTPEELPAHVAKVWQLPLVGDVAALFRAAESARNILYLADNAGEIVFDRFLIEALPAGRVTVAVRGVPVLNDATLEDAELAGLTRLTKVISNGSDAPGTIFEQTSQDFQRLFLDADLIISKGQGNYETLSDSERPIFFLLTVKCAAIGVAVGAPVGALVVKEHRHIRRQQAGGGFTK
ncbi:MAG: ARMT1-like domain-containing protein [Kiritimatiellae bacterium]|nr:ARMT1-like domain-containing protein [Kiritimatiellia bacterium]